MMKDAYGFNLRHGKLIIYGENMDLYKTYIENAVNSVSDICAYAAQRNMKVFYVKLHKIAGIKEQLIVFFLSKWYKVHSSWAQMKSFAEKKMKENSGEY